MATYSNGIQITDSGSLAIPSSINNGSSDTTYTVPANKYAIISVARNQGGSQAADVVTSFYVGAGSVVKYRRTFSNNSQTGRTCMINDVNVLDTGGVANAPLMTIEFVEFGNFN